MSFKTLIFAPCIEYRNMYRYLYIIVTFLAVQIASAQRYEVGLFLGGSNPISDVGSTFYVLPNAPAVGGLFKWNFHERMSVRIQITQTQLKGDDAQSDIPAKRNRQFSFKSSLTEFALGAEFNFFRYKIKNLLDKPMTPYVYAGFVTFWHDDLYFDPAIAPPVEATDTTKRSLDFAVPVAFGVKAKLGQRLILAGEVGFRYTLTNNLEGSVPKEKPFSFGVKGSNDWYTFSGITLTYTFGEEPCYCRK